MMTDKEIFDAIRERVGSLNQAQVDAINAVLHTTPVQPGAIPAALAWGAKVSPEFRVRARGVATRIGVDPSDFMTCMAWESGRTFSPSIPNKAGSGAIGLIQFMPTTATGLGTTVKALAVMSAVQQLDWVEKYFAPWKGKLHNLADLYMAILWPAAVGKPPEYVLWDQNSRPTTYRQNAGLDMDKDGEITKAECSAKLYAMKAEGQRSENLAA